MVSYCDVPLIMALKEQKKKCREREDELEDEDILKSAKRLAPKAGT